MLWRYLKYKYQIPGSMKVDFFTSLKKKKKGGGWGEKQKCPADFMLKHCLTLGPWINQFLCLFSLQNDHLKIPAGPWNL